MGGERSRVKTCSKGPQAEIKPCRCGEASTRGAFQEQVETCGEYAERECVDLSLVSLLVCTVCFTDEVNKQHPLWRIPLPSNHSSVRCGLWKLHMCVFVFFFKLKREFSAGVTERMDAGVSHTHSEAGRAVFLTALTIEGMNPFFIVRVSCLPSCTKSSPSLRSQYPIVTLSSITHASIGPTQNYVGRLWSAGSPSCSFLLTRTGFWGRSGFT